MVGFGAIDGVYEPITPTERLWAEFDSEVAQRARLNLFVGVPEKMAESVLLLVAAHSVEATRLLDSAPQTLRNLHHQTTVRSERCAGHIRGPILWSETITAWSSSGGGEDVFVCGSPYRDFDVTENRLFVWMLSRLALAERNSHGDIEGWFHPDALGSIRENGKQARRILASKSLQDVTRRRPTGRDLRQITGGRHRTTYSPALNLSRCLGSPIGVEQIGDLVAKPTAEHHRCLQLIQDSLGLHGRALPKWQIEGDFVASGPLRYRNPFVRVDRRQSGESGLFYNGIRLYSRGDLVDEAEVNEGRAAHISDERDADQFVTDQLTEQQLSPVLD